MSAALTEFTTAPVTMFDVPTCHFTDIGLEIEPGMKFDHWERLLAMLERAEQGIQWYLGDALNYGEQEYGEKYAQVLDAHKATGIDVDTLRNYQWVASRVKVVTRVTGVSWSAHREVATLSDSKQRKVLSRIDKKTPVHKVRREVHKVKREEGEAISEIEVIQSPEVQQWLSDLHKAVVPFESNVPMTAPFLRNMVRSMLGVIEQQSERTVQSDCEAIMRLFEGDDAPYSATDNEIFKYLLAHFYFMRDPELDDRLELLCEQKRLKYIQTGGRKENQRGDMTWVYMPFDQPVFD